MVFFCSLAWFSCSLAWFLDHVSMNLMCACVCVYRVDPSVYILCPTSYSIALYLLPWLLHSIQGALKSSSILLHCAPCSLCLSLVLLPSHIVHFAILVCLLLLFWKHTHHHEIVLAWSSSLRMLIVMRKSTNAKKACKEKSRKTKKNERWDEMRWWRKNTVANFCWYVRKCECVRVFFSCILLRWMCVCVRANLNTG